MFICSILTAFQILIRLAMGDPNAERTFIMIKPDGVQRGLVGKIIKRFETKGFKLVAMKFVWVSEKNGPGHKIQLIGIQLSNTTNRDLNNSLRSIVLIRKSNDSSVQAFKYNPLFYKFFKLFISLATT